MKDEARAWLNYAAEDLAVAELEFLDNIFNNAADGR
jgi:hypothetical protein